MATLAAEPLPAIAPRARARVTSGVPGLLLLFLPAEPAGPILWQRFEDDAEPLAGDLSDLPEPMGDRVVAVAPAEAVTLHWARLPDLAPAQARAAARLMVTETSLAAGDTLHVATGPAQGDDGDRPIAVVGEARMRGWLQRLDELGIDPDAIVPAPMLLPVADEGFTQAEIGGERVLRGRSSGFADDPVLTPILVEALPVDVLSGRRLADALRAGAKTPAIDLRQGPFAISRRFALDWALVRRMGWLALGIAIVSLLIGLAGILRYSLAADAAEREAQAIARGALPRGGAAGSDPVVALDRALAAERGGGVGFTTTAGVLFGAIQATPSVELTSIDFGADGVLRAGVRGPGSPDVEALMQRLRTAGFEVTASPFQQAEGRISGELRIALP